MRSPRVPFLVLLLLGIALLTGCSEQNAPLANPHGDDPVEGHNLLALDDLDSCTACHGEDFTGGSTGLSCYRCHDPEAPFSHHPDEWGSALADHGNFAEKYHWSFCAAAECHGEQLQGGILAEGPNCFSAPCHQSLSPVPHAAAYAAPQAHGNAAREFQGYCRNCHGALPNRFTGGFVGAPGIMDLSDGDCSGCHPDAEAHPTRWSGSNDLGADYRSTHRTVEASAIPTGCALCHKVDGPGTGPMAGAPSCFSTQFTNADGVSGGCHPNGPGVTHPTGLPWLDRNNAEFHGTSSQNCASCHELDTECDDCHFGPDGDTSPLDSWKHGLGNHQNRETYQAVCNTCHNIERQLGYDPAPCHDCHDD